MRELLSDDIDKIEFLVSFLRQNLDRLDGTGIDQKALTEETDEWMEDLNFERKRGGKVW